MRNRFIALTDIYRKPKDIQIEIDDVQSMIRLVLYANEIELEGLIATSSFCYIGGKSEDKKVILDILDAYEQVLDNLRVHDSRYPDAQYLRSITKCGIEAYGRAPGDGFADEKYASNEGVRRIMEAVERDDPRPVWFGLWGGANTLAQAVWQAEQEKTPEEFDRFLSKLRIYAIADQDHAGRWLRETYGERLFYIVSPSSGDDRSTAGSEFSEGTWRGISDVRWFGDRRFVGADKTIVSPRWIRRNVQGKTPLRRLYPIQKLAMEGDTPSFLGLVDNGLGDMEHPNYGSWGGRYEYGYPRAYPPNTAPEKYPIWTDTEDTVLLNDGRTITNGFCSIYRFREDLQNDFLVRLCWSDTNKFGEANHHPVISENVPFALTVRPGEKVMLSAEGSYDPDGDSLSYKWWNYREAGTYQRTVEISDNLTDIATLKAPDMEGEFHVILEVHDDGIPSLVRYRRIIISVTSKA